MMKNLFRRLCIIAAIATMLVGGYTNPIYALSAQEREMLRSNAPWWQPNSPASRCLDPSLTEDGLLSGHRLPATKGGTGIEEEINEQGRVKSKWGKPESDGGYVTFSSTLREASTQPLGDSQANLRQLYMDYYITMRWNYTSWNWDGSAGISGPEDRSFYSTAPRILVTNPSTGKSIIAVVLESGPAPWTGVLIPPGNQTPAQLQAWVNQRKPAYWTTAQTNTPAEYKGRVSGLPPKAIEALGATQRMQDGSGHELTYSWAPDQQAQPGPVDASTVSGDACSGGIVTIDGLRYSFPVAPQTQINYSNLPCANRTGCHHTTPGAPLATAAFDLMYGADGSMDGKDVYAITDGTITKISNPYLLPDSSGPPHPDCRAFQFVSTAEYGSTHYWYGHVKNLQFGLNEPIKVGQKVAEVADLSFGHNCRGGREHLHIDRGQLVNGVWRDGGSPCCRDIGFVEFLNTMWGLLPPGQQ